MKKNWVLVLKLAVTYVGAIVGAGFASGQELLQFFVVFGLKGRIGMIISGLLFSIIGYLIARIVIRHKISNYTLFLNKILGDKLGKLVDIWISISLFIGLGIMIAGCASVLEYVFGMKNYIGLTFSGLIVILTLIKGEKAVLNLNSLLIPALIVITVLVSLMSINISGKHVFAAGNNPLIGKYWIVATILYVSYNIITSTVILTSLDYNKLNAGINGILLGGMILCFLGLIMITAMQLYVPNILSIEVPMLYLTNLLDYKLYIAYTFAMYIAMLTTAVANGFGLAKKINQTANISKNLIIGTIVFLSLPVALYGFGNLIGHFYPIFGYIGVVLVAAILIKSIKYKE